MKRKRLVRPRLIERPLLVERIFNRKIFVVRKIFVERNTVINREASVNRDAAIRGREDMAYARHSRPDSGLDFQVRISQVCQAVPSDLESGIST